METPLGSSLSPLTLSAMSPTQGGHDLFGSWCGYLSTRNAARRKTAGAYLGWPGFECGHRVLWCFPHQWRKSSAQPSCSHALQRPLHTAAPGAGSGRGASCWRTCRTAGGKQICCFNTKQHRERARVLQGEKCPPRLCLECSYLQKNQATVAPLPEYAT